MSRENYIEHLQHKLKTVDGKIALAREKLESGTLSDKVEASAQLSLLEAKHREMDAKINAATEMHAEDWSVAHTEYREDMDALMDSLDKLLTRI